MLIFPKSSETAWVLCLRKQFRDGLFVQHHACERRPRDEADRDARLSTVCSIECDSVVAGSEGKHAVYRPAQRGVQILRARCVRSDVSLRTPHRTG